MITPDAMDLLLVHPIDEAAPRPPHRDDIPEKRLDRLRLVSDHGRIVAGIEHGAPGAVPGEKIEHPEVAVAVVRDRVCLRKRLLEPETLEIQQRERLERPVRQTGRDAERGSDLLR